VCERERERESNVFGKLHFLVSAPTEEKKYIKIIHCSKVLIPDERGREIERQTESAL
jgi:hypothetical protein